VVFCVVLLALTGVFFVVDMLTCGLQGYEHKLRLRNTTIDTFDTGDNTVGVRGSYFSTSADEFTLYNGSGIISLNGTQENLQNLSSFPLGLIVNDTYELYGSTTDQDGKVFIDSTSFWKLEFLEPKPPTVTDNGAKFNVQISNLNRKRIVSRVPWFNFGYWTPSVFLRNTLENGTGPSYSVPFTDRCNIEPAVSSLSNASNLPVWVLPLHSANHHQYAGCRPDYVLGFKPDPWFCFSPLLIREIRKTNTIVFDATLFNGLLVPDFVWDEEQASGPPVALGGAESDQITDTAGHELYINATSSRVNKLVLSSVPPDIFISADTNTTLRVQLFLPQDCDPRSRDYGINSTDACQLHFYGISGATASPESGKESDHQQARGRRVRKWWNDNVRLWGAIFDSDHISKAVHKATSGLPPLHQILATRMKGGKNGLVRAEDDQTSQYYTAQHFVTPLRYPDEFLIHLNITRSNKSESATDVLQDNFNSETSDSSVSGHAIAPLAEFGHPDIPDAPNSNDVFPLICTCNQDAGEATCKVYIWPVLHVSWNPETMLLSCESGGDDPDSALLHVSLRATH